MKKAFTPIQLNICYFDDADIITDSNEGPIIPAGFFDNLFNSN